MSTGFEMDVPAAEQLGLKPGEIALVGVYHEEDEPAPESASDQPSEESATEQQPEPAASIDNHPAKSREELERDHYAAILVKETEVYSLEREMNDAHEVYKDAKKAFEASDAALRGLIHRGPEVMPLFDGHAAETEVAAPIAESVADELAAPESNDDWRRAGIEVLQAHGLKAAMTDKLVEEGITTIGQLEDLRAGAGLKSIKGIGQGKADKIEDAVLAWLSVNRDAGILAAAAVTEPADESTSIIDRATAINTGKPNCLAAVGTDGSWESGAEAYKAGNVLDDCPLVPGESQDDWIRGWLGQKALDASGEDAATESDDGDL